MTQRKTKPKPEVTRESLLQQLAVQFDKAEVAMTRRQHDVTLNWPREIPALVNVRKAIDELTDKLEGIVNPDGDYDTPGADEAIVAHFHETPGQIPRWTRPGTFLLWLDYVPIRCVWSGFGSLTAAMFAVDPALNWLKSDGGVALMDRVYVAKDAKTIAEFFRHSLAQWGLQRERDYSTGGRKVGSRAKLVALDDEARDAARATLELPENEWLREGLRRGPVDPVALPLHLQAVQQRLFA